MKFPHLLSKDEWCFVRQFRKSVKNHPVFSKWNVRSTCAQLESFFGKNWKAYNKVLERNNMQVPWSILLEELHEFYESRKDAKLAVSEINDCITVLLRMRESYLRNK